MLRRARYVTKVAVLERDVARLQLESLVAVPTAAAAAAQQRGEGEEEGGLSAEQRAKRAEAVLRRFVEWDLGKERERVGKRRRQGEGGGGGDDGSVAEGGEEFYHASRRGSMTAIYPSIRSFE